jgi:hypothetical protein
MAITKVESTRYVQTLPEFLHRKLQEPFVKWGNGTQCTGTTLVFRSCWKSQLLLHHCEDKQNIGKD